MSKEKIEELEEEIRRLKEQYENFMLETLVYNYRLIDFASDKLRNDKEFMLKAVRRNGLSIECASKRLQDDKEVVTEAIYSGRSLECGVLFYCSKRLRDDKEFMLKAVRRNPCALKDASDRLRDDREVVAEAVKRDDSILHYASDRLKDDEELILDVARNNKWEGSSTIRLLLYPSLLRNTSHRLQNDPEFLKKIRNYK